MAYFMCAVHFILTVVQQAIFFCYFLGMNVSIRKSSTSLDETYGC